MANDATLRIGADTRQATAAINKLNRDLAAVKLDSLINLGARAKDASASLIALSGRFQQVQLTLDKVTGGDGYAKFSELSTLAGKTQFDVLSLSDSFVKLQTAGVDGATDKLTAFADIAAITTDQMGSLNALTDLFSRTTAGGLGLEDLNRLADRGIPVWRTLHEELGLTRLQLTDYGKTSEGAKEITETLISVLQTKYAGTAAEQANTVAVAWSNAGMKADELVNALLQTSGLNDAFLKLAKFVDMASTSMTNYLIESDKVISIKKLPLEERIKKFPAEIAKATEEFKKLSEEGQSWSDRLMGPITGEVSSQIRIANARNEVLELNKLYLQDLANKRKIEEDKIRSYSTMRKAEITSAFTQAFGGEDTSRVGIEEKYKKQMDALNAIEEKGYLVGAKIHDKFLRAKKRVEINYHIAVRKHSAEQNKRMHAEEKERLLQSLSFSQGLDLELFDYSEQIRKDRNEVLDRLDEARLATAVGYLNEETQALLRKHNFEVRLEEQLSQRRQQLREAEFRKQGFSTQASKEMAQDNADFAKKTEQEKTKWAIDQGAQALNALGQHSKKAFQLAKAFNIAQAVMNTYTGATKALATYPPPYNFIAAAAVIGMGLAQVATIRNQQYQGRQFGGTVTGNTPYMVGEQGPELMVPGRTGTVVPNNQLQGGTTNITFQIEATDAQGVDELIVERKDMIVNMIRSAHEDAGHHANF